MNTAKIFGYIRVSSKDQNPDRQIDSLKQKVTYPGPESGKIPGMKEDGGAPKTVPKPKKLKTIYRQVDFPVQLLQSERDVDAYVAAVKKKLMQELSDCGGIRVN